MSESNRKSSDIFKQKIVVKPQEPEENELAKEVTIVRTVPEYVPLVYVDGMVIQHKDDMFYLSFLQTQYPLVTSSAEIADVEHLEQRCLSQVVLTPKMLKRLMDAMEINYARYLEKLKASLKDKKDGIKDIDEESKEDSKAEEE